MMNNLFLKIYDFFQRHKVLRVLLPVVAVLLLAASALTLNYKEDITDFLPLDDNYRKSMDVYQNLNAADKVFVVVQMRDTAAVNPDRVVEAVDAVTIEINKRAESGKWVKDVTSQVDYEKMMEVVDFVYSNIPYFLTDADYARMDSVLDATSTAEALERDKQLLMFPASDMLSQNVERDPMNLFTHKVAQLQAFRADINYSLYDNYIFSSDYKKAIVTVTSPFGANETSNNARLVEVLDEAAKVVEAKYPDVRIFSIGAPVIAVANASQIKTDSILAISIAIILILALLIYAFRNVKSIFYIALAIGFGWIFAIGLMGAVHDRISIIVLGIGSVIIGIAVNYPLHFVAHLKHYPDVRATLKELIAPLVIGNITTVGAFLALVPLNSVALRDLGLFASFMLVGTILFVIVVLPQMVKSSREAAVEPKMAFARLSKARVERRRGLLPLIVVITVALGWFSLDTRFDADMHHINYMTPEQRQDFADLQKMIGKSDGTAAIYVAAGESTWDGALAKAEAAQPVLDSLVAHNVVLSRRTVADFLPSKAEQQRRLVLWQRFCSKYADRFGSDFDVCAHNAGFSSEAFDGFKAVVSGEYPVREYDYFRPLTETVFGGFLSHSDTACAVVDVLTVDASRTEEVHRCIAERLPHSYSFDVAQLNSTIARSLSDEFNYIAWACGLIVFVFLWISFGRLELALVAFAPMAVGWIWILGMMNILGIEFNIVNVILATFIFGQGDDYSIFITEGLMYERAYGKKVLDSYKSSIIISALIMFVGIGTLIVAKHPALRSLAEVTIVGMITVVVMAYLLPPLLFRFLVTKKGVARRLPVTIADLWRTVFATTIYLLQLFVGLVLGVVLFKLMKKSEGRRLFYHKCMYHFFRFDARHIPGVEFDFRNPYGESFERPAIIICNHQSILDPMYFMMLTPKVLVGTGEHVWKNRVIHRVLRFSDFFTVGDGVGSVLDQCRDRIREGYSIAVYPEGARSHDGRILRFHNGSFYLAEQLGLDILPIFIHGLTDVMPKSSGVCFRGKITVEVGKRLAPNDISMGDTYQQRTKAMRHFYEQKIAQMSREIETARYFHHLVAASFAYKGFSIERAVAQELKRTDCYAKWVDNCPGSGRIVVKNNGYGVAGLLFALVNSDREVIALDDDADMLSLAAANAANPRNLTIAASYTPRPDDTIFDTREL